MKKVALILLCLVFSSAIMACSTNNYLLSNNGDKDPRAKDKHGETDVKNGKAIPKKLTFWGGVPAESGPQNVVDAWNKLHPDIQVQYVRYVNDDDGNLKLDTALITDQDVDLYVNYGVNRLERRVDAGVALDLGRFEDYNIEEKMGNEAKAWLLDDKYYAMPTKKDLFFYWLNKDALEEAGLEVPTEWDWEDVANYAKILKQDNRYGLVKHMETYSDMLDGSLSAYEYKKADGTSFMDHPTVGIWLKGLKEMMDDGVTPSLGEQLMTKIPVDTIFLKGEAAMLDAGEWIFRSSNDMEANPRNFTIAFAPIPSVLEGQVDYKTRGGLGDGISINAKSELIDEAWEFLKWYADGGMTPMAVGGRLPASKDADIDEAIEALLGAHADTYDAVSLKHAVFGAYNTFHRNLPQQMIDIRKEEYEKYFLGYQDLQATLDAMVRRHNEYIANSS